MKKALGLFCLLVLVSAVVKAQKGDTLSGFSSKKNVPVNLVVDSAKERDRTSQTLRDLKNGAVIIRLKTGSKSIDAYRKAGQNDVADRIEAEHQKQNQKMFWAFTENFLFCDVYFIYANETDAFLGGKRGLFLNQQLQHDSSIVFEGTNFVFCEYGSVQPFSKFSDYEKPKVGTPGNDNAGKSFGDGPVQTATSPATTSGLFFSDRELKQFNRPFPFVESVYFDNFVPTVRTLNREMQRAYERLVVNRDFKEKVKAEKRKAKAEHKKLPAYNPFK
jgi:hypothetical protein